MNGRRRSPAGHRVVPASDGLPALLVDEWWKDKHFYIQGYDSAFNVAMRQKWAYRPYVDLLAGPGLCVTERGEEIPGSPLIALGCKELFTHYFFNDGDPTLAAALERRSAPMAGANIHCFNLDCNEAAQRIASQLPDPRTSLGLAFIDPYGWEVHLSSLEWLTAGRRMDLLITFHSGAIRRWADEAPAQFDDFFGGPEWHDEYMEARESSPRSRSRILLDIYEARLSALGYPHVADDILIRNKQDVPIYHLVFASKSPFGKELWRKITARSRAGHRRLL